ncbi:ubiquitin E3 ligase ICP0 [Equid alphaherpesvirus 3]|uniref:RING-type E3 ubiquitin transferase n=1 Tax=Equid alphaherpesvirus 3 TaxID=80341 RepID=A0A077B626_9ALPH|nr:ubiquitin E3 ligase ICP0 [Equid alphaherpesvirus 3]AIL02980.1 ubiquitin E3 ligase ICP0 [Equid alphaherpesvirus 3]
MDPQENPCAICLEPPEDVSAALPCLHRFCHVCLTRWVALNPRCPLCKTPVTSLLHAIENDREFKETAVNGGPVAEYDEAFENALTPTPPQDRESGPASSRTGPAAFVPLNANGTAGAPRFQPLVDWMSERLEDLFETHDFALVMRNIVMDGLCEYGCNEAELTRLLWPLIHDDTAAFVAGLVAEARRCVSGPAAVPHPGRARGVEFIDSSSSSSEDEESDFDDDSEVDTDDLTDPEDTEYDDSEPESTHSPLVHQRGGCGSAPATPYPIVTRSGRRGPPPARAANQDGAATERPQSRRDLRRRGHLSVIDLTLDSDTEDEANAGRRDPPALGAQAGSQPAACPARGGRLPSPGPRATPAPGQAFTAPPGAVNAGRPPLARTSSWGPTGAPKTSAPAAPAPPAVGSPGRGPRYGVGEFVRRFAELAPRVCAPPEALNPAIVAWVEGFRPQPGGTAPPAEAGGARRRLKGVPRRWTEERAARLRGGVVRGAGRQRAPTPYPVARRPLALGAADGAARRPPFQNTRGAAASAVEGRSSSQGR